MTDPSTIERAMQLRRMTSEFVRNLTPQQRDRMMQIHLAQARGPIKNAMLLRQITARLLKIRKARLTEPEDER